MEFKLPDLPYLRICGVGDHTYFAPTFTQLSGPCPASITAELALKSKSHPVHLISRTRPQAAREAGKYESSWFYFREARVTPMRTNELSVEHVRCFGGTWQRYNVCTCRMCTQMICINGPQVSSILNANTSGLHPLFSTTLQSQDSGSLMVICVWCVWLSFLFLTAMFSEKKTYPWLLPWWQPVWHRRFYFTALLLGGLHCNAG